MNFEQFCASTVNHAWIREPGISMYVRATNYKPTNFDLANLNADNPGHGALTKFLDRYEGYTTFYVENIMNERLVRYLERRGYVIVRCDVLPSMAKPL